MRQIIKLIESDSVGIAYNTILEKWRDKKLSANEAYYFTISLNKLVSSSLKSKQPCRSEPGDVFRLAELCCKVKDMWLSDQTGCMQCIYHVMLYLLNQSEPLLSRKLCEFFFHHCLKDKNGKWAEKEKVVLSNTVTYFCHYLYDTKQELVKFPHYQLNPNLFWFEFLLKINEFNNFHSTSDFFQIFYSLQRRAQSSGSHLFYSEILCELVEAFSKHLRNLFNDKPNWSPKTENITSFTMILSDILVFLGKEPSHSALPVVGSVCEFIKCIKTLVSFYPMKDVGTDDIQLLELTFNMFATRSSKNKFGSNFVAFYNATLNKENYSVEVNSLIFNCLSIIRSEISDELLKDKNMLLTIFPFIYGLFMKSKSKLSGAVSNKKQSRNELLHAFTAATYFLNCAKLESNGLKELLKPVRLFFREFHYIVECLGKYSFECGVSYCINIIQSYKSAELYKETATLSRDLIKIILLLDRSFLSPEKMKNRIQYLLNDFITGYGKINLSADAQLGLLAFAGVHPQLIDVVFKYWAELKVNFTDFNCKKVSCSYEILVKSKADIEEIWKPCKVENINMETFLLEEIKAYSKYRDLQVGPVIAAYRASVNLIKDKLVLAQILSAVVDSISSDEFNPSLNNLKISIDNVLGSLARLKEQTSDRHKLCQINCFIGNLYYQKVRFDIAHIRKKAESEFDLLENITKEDIPILEGDAARITPAYSCLKLEEQAMIAEEMFQALDHWNSAGDVATEQDGKIFSLNYCKGLAYIFRLYCYKEKEAETWKLIYSLSTKFSYSKYTILAFAELLGLSYSVDPSWFLEVKAILNVDESLKKTYVYTLYLINQAKNQYLNRNFEEANSLSNGIDESTLKKFFLLSVQHKHLGFLLKLEMFPSFPNRLEKSLLGVIRSFEHLLYFLKMKTWRTFPEKCIVQWLLLDISMTLGKTFLDLKCVRHARAYHKKQLVVAQRLALPFRVCEFLGVLSAIDLTTGNIIEADQKLNGLDMILELDHVEVDNKNDPDCYFIRASTKKDIKNPEFLNHGFECACIFCNNPDFRAIILDAFKLKTMFTWSNGSEDITRHILSIGVKIIDFIHNRGKTDISNYPNSFAESEARFYLLLSYIYASWGEMDKALSYNRVAVEVTKGITSNWLLIDELSFQQSVLNWCSWKPPTPVKYQAKVYAQDNSAFVNVRTPEITKPASAFSKYLKSAISPSALKMKVSPKATFAKKVLLDEFEMNGEGSFKTSDKENFGSPDPSNSKSTSAVSPLARALPKLPFKRNLLDDISNAGNTTPKVQTEWVLETPKPEVTLNSVKATRPKTRQAQTEKKIKKPLSSVDLFSTPFPSKVKPEFKIFCDDGDKKKILLPSENSSVQPKKTITTVKKTTTRKAKKALPKIKNSRQLAFDSDSEEEIIPKSTRKPPPLGRRLFEEHKPNEETTEIVSLDADDSGIIEQSFIEQKDGRLCLPLTHRTLEESMKQLSLSGKKILPLSTKRMTRLRKMEGSSSTSQHTPVSSRSTTKTTR